MPICALMLGNGIAFGADTPNPVKYKCSVAFDEGAYVTKMENGFVSGKKDFDFTEEFDLDVAETNRLDFDTTDLGTKNGTHVVLLTQRKDDMIDVEVSAKNATGEIDFSGYVPVSIHGFSLARNTTFKREFKDPNTSSFYGVSYLSCKLRKTNP